MAERFKVVDHPVPFRWDGRLPSHPVARYWLRCILDAHADDTGQSGVAGEELFTVDGDWTLDWPAGSDKPVRLELLLLMTMAAPLERWGGVPTEDVFEAARQLVAHWPRPLMTIEATVPGSSVAAFGTPCPDWLPAGTNPGTPGLARSIAWEAMRRIVAGRPAELAIQEAHALAGSMEPESSTRFPFARTAWAVPETWEVAVPESVAWMFRPLKGRVHGGDMVDGFRLGVLAGGWRDRFQRFTGVLAESGGARQRWLVVGRLSSVRRLGPLAEGVHMRMRVDPLPHEAYGQATLHDRKRAYALWQALRAWPEGQKMLIVPHDALAWGIRLTGGGPHGWVAVRLDGMRTAELAQAFHLACWQAGKGLDEQRLRQWIAGLTPDDVRGLAALHALAR